MSELGISSGYGDGSFGLESPTGAQRPLVMKFGGSLVEQLGAQLYPSVTATVAELISNAWDADAKNVWITIPFEADWSLPTAEIVVIDDGHGMTRAEAQSTYLVVGRKKRLGPNGDRSENGRPVHGRKGIGKLAAFGTASYLECTTVRDGETTAFGIDYDELRRLNPDQNYYVDPVKEPAPLVAPTGQVLDSGTRVRLSGLRVKRKISQDSFHVSMSRRFALRGMEVWINGRPLLRYSIPLEYRIPDDYNPEGLELDDEGWAIEYLPSGDRISWWIGFTAKPLAESDQQGISVLARDKMAQRPFKFDRSQGTTAQLGFEYLVGEVKADWLDSGEDIDTDYIQSNRDQLQLENERLDEFMNWGRRRLSWALRARQELRSQAAEAAIESDSRVRDVLTSVDKNERRALTSVARRLAKLPEVDADQLADVMRAVVDTREDTRLRVIARDISQVESSAVDTLWPLVDRAIRIDARRIVAVLETRIAALETLQSVADAEDFEPLASRLRENPWILDPRWSSMVVPLGLEESAESAGSSFIVLKPSPPAPVDQLVLIQAIATRPAIERDVERFHTRLDSISRRFPDASVDAMLVAPALDVAMPERRALEGGVVRYLRWSAALEGSLARHRAWHAAAKARVAAGELD